MNIYLTRLILLVSIILTSLLMGVSTDIFDKSEPYKIFAENEVLTPSNKHVEKLWETQTDLKNPESVVYDSTNNILYVSNVDGKPTEKDNKGFLSKLSPDNGHIIKLKWVSNLNAPKGIDLNINANKLYVSDLSELIEVDISSGEITNRYPAQENSYLNDVVVDGEGKNVFVSDPPNNSIYVLHTENSDENSTLQMWLQSDDLNGPNGLLIDSKKNSLIVVSMGNNDSTESGGSIKVIDLNNKTVSELGKERNKLPVGILDGIEGDSEEKYYYVSDWNAKNVHVVNTNGTGYYQLFDIPIQGTADLEFIDSENIIIVPLMQDNKLVAFKLGS